MRGITSPNTLIGLALGVALGIVIADWVKPKLRGVLGQVLTDTRFWLGVAVGAVAVYFVLPYVRGQMATRQTLQRPGRP